MDDFPGWDQCFEVYFDTVGRVNERCLPLISIKVLFQTSEGINNEVQRANSAYLENCN